MVLAVSPLIGEFSLIFIVFTPEAICARIISKFHIAQIVKPPNGSLHSVPIQRSDVFAIYCIENRFFIKLLFPVAPEVGSFFDDGMYAKM